MSEILDMASIGGELVEGGFDSLLDSPTPEERADDAEDIKDLVQSEHDAANERPYFI